MPTETPVPQSDPLMKSWDEFKQSDEFKNAMHWASQQSNPAYIEGSLWAAYARGFKDATERAADLCEQVDSASDAERLENIPGAGAMGAVIEYRDKIRKTVAVAA